jgi:hypothetical protein
MICKRCKEEEEVAFTGFCEKCLEDYIKENDRINALVDEGHSPHCACQQVWQFRECICKKGGE